MSIVKTVFRMISSCSVLICLCIITTTTSIDVTLLSKTRTSFLEKYEGYSNIIMIHLKIPQDTLFASFKFVADETQMSVFSCSVRNVSIYMKHGSPPVINPDGSVFPKSFKNITRSKLYNYEFQTDKKEIYINVSSPEPGSYYATTFLSYTDPKDNAITQQGLSPSCYASVEAALFVKKADNPIIISENDLVELIFTDEERYFKFYVQNLNNHGILLIEDIYFSEFVENLVIRIDINKPPSTDTFQVEEIIYPNASVGPILFWTKPETWHYIQFVFENETMQNKEGISNLTFRLRYFSNNLPDTSVIYSVLENKTVYNNSVSKTFYNNKISDTVPYKHYDLVREASTESFLFSFELEEEVNSNVAVPVNMTNRHFSLFKFNIREGFDTGGSLQFIMAFKPRVNKINNKISFENEPEEHVIVACIRKGAIEMPTWPDKCVLNGIEKPSQLILNKTVDNSTLLIPFPESGTWYASFKLFCGKCVPCNCSDECQNLYEECTTECELNCNVNSANCSFCIDTCKKNVIESEPCVGCNCDGPCLINENDTCNSSIIFDIGSQPCVSGRCSENGRCMFMVSDGVVFSTCVCSNKYRGWDCTDGSQATPYYMVVLELLLLVLSNLAFLPSVYIAFKRKYYIESITYFAICFFSTFYHACDAGENIISYCLVRLSALQFGDFFCALLAIWVTLIAIADIPPLITSVCHMIGAIVLSFCTTINKTALWIFALPVLSGVVIVAVSWYLKYRKVKQRFANKRYLFICVPIGTLIVTAGLIMYAFLQTESNYKYLHSLWHIIMAVALLIVLPKPNTFLPEVLL